MRVVDSWTGELADLLRRAFRMTIEDFADKQLGVAPRTVAYWRQRPSMIPKAEQQAILDTALERATDAVKARFALLVDRASEAQSLQPSIVRRQQTNLTACQPPEKSTHWTLSRGSSPRTRAKITLSTSAPRP